MKNLTIFKKALYFTLILAILGVFLIPQVSLAAALTSMKDTQTRLKKSITANHTIVFTTPTGIAVGNTVTLTFQSGYNIASVVTGDVTLQGAAVTSAVPVGQVLTITAAAGNVVAAAGTATIAINNNHITNPGTAGSYTLAIAGTFGDTGTLAIATADEDQVSITATVNPYITFNVTQPTVSLGVLDVAAVKYATATMTASTNASGGYIITVSGGSLTNGSHTITAIGGTAAASSVGTEQFGLNLKANTTPSVGANPSGGTGAAVGQYAIANSFAFLTGDTVANSAGAPSTTTTFTMSYIANIANSTNVGSYTATHTYICTGTF